MLFSQEVITVVVDKDTIALSDNLFVLGYDVKVSSVVCVCVVCVCSMCVCSMCVCVCSVCVVCGMCVFRQHNIISK